MYKINDFERLKSIYVKSFVEQNAEIIIIKLKYQ